MCYAKDADYIEFSGLPGSIKSGCHATPAYKSRYCSDHLHLACDSRELTGDEDGDDGQLDSHPAKGRDRNNLIARVLSRERNLQPCGELNMAAFRHRLMKLYLQPNMFYRRWNEERNR